MNTAPAAQRGLRLSTRQLLVLAAVLGATVFAILDTTLNYLSSHAVGRVSTAWLEILPRLLVFWFVYIPLISMALMLARRVRT